VAPVRELDLVASGGWVEQAATRSAQTPIMIQRSFMSLFVVANRVPVATAWEEQFEECFRNQAGQVEKQPGFCGWKS
jgi:hypothetical protein